MTSLPGTPSTVSTSSSGGASGRNASNNASHSSTDSRVVDKRRLQDLVKEVDPLEQLDEEVEEVSLSYITHDNPTGRCSLHFQNFPFGFYIEVDILFIIQVFVESKRNFFEGSVLFFSRC